MNEEAETHPLSKNITWGFINIYVAIALAITSAYYTGVVKKELICITTFYELPSSLSPFQMFLSNNLMILAGMITIPFLVKLIHKNPLSSRASILISLFPLTIITVITYYLGMNGFYYLTFLKEETIYLYNFHGISMQTFIAFGILISYKILRKGKNALSLFAI